VTNLLKLFQVFLIKLLTNLTIYFIFLLDSIHYSLTKDVIERFFKNFENSSIETSGQKSEIKVITDSEINLIESKGKTPQYKDKHKDMLWKLLEFI